MSLIATPQTNNEPLSESSHGILKDSQYLEQNVLSDMQVLMVNQERKDVSRTLSIDRTNDNVYSTTTNVVKAIMSLSHGVEKAAAVEYIDLVRFVGIELRTLLSAVDTLASTFPSQALKYEKILFFAI